MTPAGEVLAAEIRRDGPIPFHRFMEVALYHPEHGYYRQAHDPFGISGDFFTAEQLQPVFGILIAARIRQVWREMGEPADFTVVELGAGRGEMTAAFSEWRYLPIEIGSGDWPMRFTGVVFSNEFFDALPVEAAIYRGGTFREQRVALAGGRFVWQTTRPVRPEAEEYFRRYFPPPEEGCWYEANFEALRWLDRIARSLDSGLVLTIDYGYTRPEWARFPAGSLMSYRRHAAFESVLEDPGSRDITAHVNFAALQEAGAERGLPTERFETLAALLIAAGEPDQFAAALGAEGAAGRGAVWARRRLQLKTLLFGMGETFRALWQRAGRK